MSSVQSYNEILQQIDAVKPVAYAKTRNHLAGAVTGLSPYISRGIVSLPKVRDRLLVDHSIEDAKKLIQELAWREYFQNVWWAKGDDIFSDLRFARVDWQHEELVAALVNAETGVTVLDEGVKALYETGYLHNHLRMWIASVACNLARAHWHEMGRWMYYHLSDGDPASNFCSWQWVAGTSVNKRYTVNQSLINACSDSTQTGTILDFERETMLEQPIPAALTATEAVALEAEYPSEEPAHVRSETVLCYTPWTLDPTWRADEEGDRILIIDPTFFDRYPVSEAVFDFIVRQGKTVMPELQVHVGALEDISGYTPRTRVCAIAHPTNQDWPATFDEPARLFPAVTGYYPSFFKYWQAVTKAYRDFR